MFVPSQGKSREASTYTPGRRCKRRMKGEIQEREACTEPEQFEYPTPTLFASIMLSQSESTLALLLKSKHRAYSAQELSLYHALILSPVLP
eukprot:3933513-Rhodomonas_salina.1